VQQVQQRRGRRRLPKLSANGRRGETVPPPLQPPLQAVMTRLLALLAAIG
jgi:hypothetical protein